eukprot:TRINITY_DN1254_c0_g1_i1.p1 TRINITY_DN1254_c0_g1~~TRINITY_DN1254_c0_g1_i1.p1  ORF type:complete len:409 (+),score=138.59 TRINITY_DN1254_c0_g1_i1:147-1373(+)
MTKTVDADSTKATSSKPNASSKAKADEKRAEEEAQAKRKAEEDKRAKEAKAKRKAEELKSGAEAAAKAKSKEDERLKVDLSDVKAEVLREEEQRLQIEFDTKLPTASVKRIAKSRSGQSLVRDRALELFGTCAMCGDDWDEMLIAAHIVRWADDPKERGNLRNVLLLCRTHDVLFEKGYVVMDDAEGHLVFRVRNAPGNHRSFDGIEGHLVPDHVDRALAARHRERADKKGKATTKDKLSTKPEDKKETSSKSSSSGKTKHGSRRSSANEESSDDEISASSVGTDESRSTDMEESSEDETSASPDEADKKDQAATKVKATTRKETPKSHPSGKDKQRGSYDTEGSSDDEGSKSAHEADLLQSSDTDDLPISEWLARFHLDKKAAKKAAEEILLAGNESDEEVEEETNE